MTLEARTVVGGYAIEEMIGRGGMGVVYRARHVELGRQVALKVIAAELSADPEFVARFQREGRLQASLEHPHVVTVYEAGESEHGLYLVMRLVQGSTLAELLRERALDARRALSLLRQVADALDAAHAAGLVHRDVKPQNVLVGEPDDAYLGDFGLTRVGEEGATAAGRLMGTVPYLAPEVIKGGPAVPASDRYAFAAMLFECLAGSVVFPRTTEAATLYAHTNEPPPRISRRREELPQALDEVLAGALSKDPGERPESAVALVDAVAETLDGAGASGLGPPPPVGASALDEDTVEPLPDVTPPRSRPTAGRRTVPWLIGALAGAAVATGLWALLDDGEESQTAAPPATVSGATVLGSDLAQAGRTVDCRARPPRPSSPSCTIVQSELPEATLVVPEDGVIRRWAVRSARGELALSVVRPRSDGPGQIARSRNEFVGSPDVHAFTTNIAVRRGDLLGLIAVPGSAVGARTGVDGAATRRWIPLLNGTREVDFEAGTGFDDELLLRVELFPGEEQALPKQVSGAAAARLDPGVVHERRRLRFSNGRPVEIALVEVDDHFAFDEFIEGRRTARIDVPDFRPEEGGAIVSLEVYAEAAPQELGIYVEHVNVESARVLNHFFSVYPREFQFIN